MIGKKRVRQNKAGQRFEAQFQLLESLEAEYLIYKSTLKPESEFLRNLKSKIDQLKESLKRPNEILVKYKELLKISERDESLLSQIENELIVTKLDLSRQRDPWDLISQPTIDDARIWPLKKQIVISTFLISILLALTISLILFLHF